jgi:hypothetical protein
VILCHSHLPQIYEMSKDHSRGFSHLEDQLSETNQCAFIISFDHSNSSMMIEYTVNIPDFDSSPSSNAIPISSILANLYLTASSQYAIFLSASTAPSMQNSSTSSPSYLSSNSLYPAFAATKKSLSHSKFAQSSQTYLIIFGLFETSLVIPSNICQNSIPILLCFCHPLNICSNEKLLSTKITPAISYGQKSETLCTIFIRNQEKGFAWSDNE